MSVLTEPSKTVQATASPGSRPGWIVRRRGPLGASVVVIALCFLQAPGRIIADSKLDLVIDPAQFMARATHLWDTHQAFGQIQNQAVGYLFPMGPFFALGHLLGMPAWVVQRSWMALLLVVAMWGLLRVAEAMRLGTPGSRLLAAAGYALSPAMLSVIGIASAGQLPTALVPWALLPLVRHRDEDSPIRTAALSGIAVACMGGVNAASTLAVLPIPFFWILTRPRGTARRRLLGCWIVAVGAATLWWVGPLLLQARYGYDFLRFTENAKLTTGSASLFETTRGTGYWLSYLNLGSPWLRAGWTFVSEGAVVLASAVLAAAGLYGLARREVKERRFLVLTLLAGVVVLTAGYGGPLTAPFGGAERSLLDGPLSAFRNLNKFEPLIRFPVALGLAAAVSSFSSRSVRRFATRTLAVVLGIAVAPLWQGTIAPDGTFARVPAYWSAAAQWLDHRAGPGSTLVVPSAAFGEYSWGRPLDEPMQALAERPWAVRNLVPLGSVGATRVMDTVEAQLESGAPSDALAQFLARAGIRFLLVRNDLDPARSGAPAPEYLRRAVEGSPGMVNVASFGPVVPTVGVTDRLVPDLGRSVESRPARSLEIYEVYGQPSRVATYDQSTAVGVSGAPDGLFPLAGDSSFYAQAVALLGDPDAPRRLRAGDVVTDAVARRDVQPGGVRNNASWTLAANEPAPATGSAPQDGAVVPDDAHRSVIRMTGAKAITSSSYDGPTAQLPEHQPYAAFDSDPSTAWVTGSFKGPIGQWIQVDLAKPISPSAITVQLLVDQAWRPRPTAVTISTERGAVTWPVLPVEGPQTMIAPQGTTRSIRITIAGVQFPPGSAGGAGFREITIPGVSVARTLALPMEPRSKSGVAGDRAIVLDRSHADPYDNTRSDEETTLRRLFALPAPGAFTITGTVLPVPGILLNGLISAATPSAALKVNASSTWKNLPAFGAARLLDGDPGTAWVASPNDPTPTLNFSWSEPRTVDSLTFTAAGGGVRVPTTVTVTGSVPLGQLDVPPDGHVHFPPMLTDHLVITVATSQLTAESADVRQGRSALPIGIADVGVSGVEGLRPSPPDPSARFHLDCGQGPPIEVDGNTVQTSVDGTVGDLIEVRPLRVSTCGGAFELGAGQHTLSSGNYGAPLVLTTARVASPESTRVSPPARTATVRSWHAEDRVVRLTAGPASYLAFDENFNPGWTATLHGSTLKAVRLDGWRQAFAVPAGGSGDVTLSFRPGRTYRALLVLGLLGLFALAVVAIVPGRRRRRSAPASRGPEVEMWVSRSPLGATAAFLAVYLLGLVLGGVVGAIVAVVMTAAVVLTRRWELLAPIAGCAFVVAGMDAAIRAAAFPGNGSGAFGPVAQVFSLVAVLAVALTLLRQRGSPS